MLNSVFTEDIRKPFDARRFSMPRQPEEGFAFSLAKPNRAWTSRNHWLIKPKQGSYVIFDDLEPDVRRFCQKAMEFMRAYRLPFEDRYLYLTVDDRWVSEGDTQRVPGWHIDGMQGSEVETPTPGCFQFLWCDHTPMEYSTQSFETKGLDRHKVNFFDSLGNQVNPDSVKRGRSGLAYLMSPYQVHRARPVAQNGRRKLLRLSASHQPITSVKVTINPYMEYDHPIHVTSGEIPDHLVTLHRRSPLRRAA